MGQRRRMAEVLFEQHRLEAVYFALSPVLALYASGLCTGVSVELGHAQSHVMPVYQGVSLFHATHALDLGGVDLTEWIAAHHPGEVEAPTLRTHEAWGYLKEKYAFTPESREAYAGDDANGLPTTHQLPDGSMVELGEEMSRAAELYFRPTTLPRLANPPDQFNVSEEVNLRTTTTPLGLHQLIAQSINDCDEDLSALFASNIVLSGGASLLKNLPSRLEFEVQSLAPALPERARVLADSERGDAVFVGGSILASLSTFQNLWVKRSEYEEIGSSAVVRGCF
ncbi:unnamed protein product [Phytomonas sp. Hart1]|nr:unnamed protein product [Phytomonas sp. Hart1]|eukprot:CCW67806.1 unnamed protein product [Phytomonas sp. isolate Hart1]